MGSITQHRWLEPLLPELLAEHGVTWPTAAQHVAQRLLGGQVGVGDRGQVGLGVDPQVERAEPAHGDVVRGVGQHVRERQVIAKTAHRVETVPSSGPSWPRRDRPGVACATPDRLPAAARHLAVVGGLQALPAAQQPPQRVQPGRWRRARPPTRRVRSPAPGGCTRLACLRALGQVGEGPDHVRGGDVPQPETAQPRRVDEPAPSATPRPAPSRRASAEEEVWRPRPVTALTVPMARSAAGTSALNSVDLPTPEWPTSTLTRPVTSSRRLVQPLVSQRPAQHHMRTPSGS